MLGRKPFAQDINQLLIMIETASEEDRDELLNQIQLSDPAKASILRIKMITPEKVFHLDDESLSRVLEDVDDQIVADSLRGLDIELRKRALSFLSGSRKKEIGTMLKKERTPSELSVSRRALTLRVRELESRGRVSMGGVRSVASKKVAA